MSPLFKSQEFETQYQLMIMNMCSDLVNNPEVNAQLQVFIDEYGLDFDPNEALTEHQEHQLDSAINAFYARLGADILHGFLMNNVGMTPEERAIENQETEKA